ncbi:MAG: hypothetical protein ACAI25_11820 [Planctomycetota bacterium]
MSRLTLLLTALGVSLTAFGADRLGPRIAERFGEPAAITSARAVLAEVLRDPGYEFQLCSNREVSLRKFSPYSFSRGELRISPENLARLREVREGAIVVTIERLDASIDEWVKRGPDALGVAPYVSSEFSHRLAVLIDLNASDELPRLLKTLERTRGSGAEYPHTEVLTTITALLRQERFQPLLDSEIEAAFRRWLGMRFVKRPIHPIGSIAHLSEWERRLCRVDPVTGLVHPFDYFANHPVLIELTPEREKMIETWARDFLAATPPEARWGARGMDPWPIVR